MSRQAALLLALGSLAMAAALISFGTWILLRRSRPESSLKEEPAADPDLTDRS
jgi:hypothetical protein